MTGKRPNLCNMHVFGSKCFAYVTNKKKLDDRCEKGYFVGYDCQSPAYLVYFSNNRAVKKIRCVKFRDFTDQIDPIMYIYPETEPNIPNVTVSVTGASTSDVTVPKVVPDHIYILP